MEKQVIVYGGIPVGITIAENGRLKFVAVKYPVIDLDGRYYNSIADLREAIHTHLVNASADDQAVFSSSESATLPRKAFNAA
ncbi:MAG: hypothetical protein ACOH2J_20690 [Allorhizobium sp.]